MIITLLLAGMPMLAQACSPALISPRDAMQAPGPTARLTRIVLAGSPCGSEPRLGQQVLVFLLPNGFAHVLERPVRERSLLFDPAYLDQVRACVSGHCDQTAR
jgi:hypothetical protein